MATFQSKTSRGHKYMYIVESVRVNGKPRPRVVEYLGKADNLSRRLKGLTEKEEIKSYSHGAVAALLDTARKLDVAALINKYINSPRAYVPSKPVRHNLTAGMSLLLAAIGRACEPTSKRGWSTWALTTSMEYLLHLRFAKVDSQHFWDMMDALPSEAIEKIEKEFLNTMFEIYQLETDSLFFDTTNTFTFIASSNGRCTIAQRGRNKQKRDDLRQVGLAMVVTREDMVPLFHLTYRGNMHDSKVYQQVIGTISRRMDDLSLDKDKHTLVFDRGINSKENLAAAKKLSLHYVGALTPYLHNELASDALANLETIVIGEKEMHVFRDKRTVWGDERTVVAFISDKLRAGRLRVIYQQVEKKLAELEKVKKSLLRPLGKSQERGAIEAKIRSIVRGQYISDVIDWSLSPGHEGGFELKFSFEQNKLEKLEDELGLRILMTDRHEWSSVEIIQAYCGQSRIEQTFKNLKNHAHLSLRPQFHWTDQKIIVHSFICVLGYQLAALIWHQVKKKCGFSASLDTLLDKLNNIRLVMMAEKSKTPGPPKATYVLEKHSKEDHELLEALDITEYHIKRPYIRGISVYNN